MYLRVALPQKLEDLTLIFYFKAQNYPGMELHLAGPRTPVSGWEDKTSMSISAVHARVNLPYTYWCASATTTMKPSTP